MTIAVRFTSLAGLLLALAMAAAGCAPTSGPLGTPASPVVSPDTSGAPAPTDVAPESPSAAPTPTAAPSSSSAPGGASPSATEIPVPTASPVATMLVRAYFFLDSTTGNEGLVPVLREIPATRAVATAAMRELLKGPQGAELARPDTMSTAIPDSTRLLGVTVADGLATVDLSGEFSSGGGATSVLGRLAQVVYTLTQFPTVDRVQFELDGLPVTTFSGEGVLLDSPVKRADYRYLLPAIFVDRPAWGAAAGNPMRLSGIANVFEAQFVVQVLDGKGDVLVEEPVRASCGTGCWGTFRTDVAYEIGKGQYGTLRVFEPSARDGSPVNVTEYRVWLTP